MEQAPLKLGWIIKEKFAISQCPGKNLKVSRTGKPIIRDLESDIKQFKDLGIEQIFCLLDKYELRTIGVDEAKYKKLCEKFSIKFVQLQILECAAPKQTLSEIDTYINICLEKNTLCHCRGGIGRAGLIASCILLKLNIQKNVKNAVQQVRQIRDKRCVESQNQYDFIKKYDDFLKNQNI